MAEVTCQRGSIEAVRTCCQPPTPTVLIACTSAHRNTGVFDVALYGVDRLKEIVPVWKKEIGPQGQEWVEGSYIPKPGK